MSEVIEIALVALASFVSTSTDNLILLSVLLAQQGQRRLPVLLGYSFAAVVIAIVGLLVARAADVVPQNWLGYLGVIPIGMGLWRLARAFRRSSISENQGTDRHVLGGAGVAVLMLANSSDTLAVLASLFAETEEPLTYVIAVTVVTASVCWFGIALAVSGHSLLRRGIARLERWLVPILLIGIGLYILADTATDTL